MWRKQIEFLELKTNLLKTSIMKLSKEQKTAILTCVNDLENYYATCGNDLDFQNLEILKIYINSKQLCIENIDVVAEIVEVSNSKKK